MKKNAVKFLTALVALAILGLPALAQTEAQPAAPRAGRHHGQMPSVDERVQHLTKKLNLNDDQQAKVKSILEDQQKQMASLRQDTSLSQQDRRSKFKDIHQDTMQKVRGVLNPDQQKQFDQMQAKRKERMEMHHRGGQQGAGSPDKQ